LSPFAIGYTKKAASTDTTTTTEEDEESDEDTSNSTSVKTGDATPVTMLIFVMMASLMVLAGFALTSMKKDEE
nr:hypothetical protein [Lachnospiraceae bacterium]